MFVKLFGRQKLKIKIKKLGLIKLGCETKHIYGVNWKLK